MDVAQLESLALLRAVIAYLGEREQHAWWQSSFFGPGSQAFLAPLFARTQTLAQCMGVSRAAALIHDERIGVGHVYHLFRLPETVEQGIHRSLHDTTLCDRISTLVSSREAALAYLRQEGSALPQAGVGPTRLGSTQELHDPDRWCIAAAHYAAAFARGEPVFPYFGGAR